MAFGIRDVANSLNAIQRTLVEVNQTLRRNGEQTARLAEAVEARNKMESERRFSAMDLGIQFKTDESSPARTRGDKVERDVR